MFGAPTVTEVADFIKDLILPAAQELHAVLRHNGGHRIRSLWLVNIRETSL